MMRIDPRVAAGCGILLCVLAPFVLPVFWVTLANTAGIAAIVVVGLVVLTGVGGMTSFGQASFVGFGAYATALLTTAGVSPWLALPVSLLAAGVAALLIGLVTLRLSGHYLALGTLAWSVSLFYLAANLDVLGRNDGLRGIPPLTVAGTALIDPRLYFVVVWLGVGVAVQCTRHLLDSRVGRTLRALRAGAVAGGACGIDVPRTRLLAFVYAAVLAGFAGWLYAHMQRSVNPTPFDLEASIAYLLMVVVGGAAHPGGAVLGAVLVTVLRDRLQTVLPLLLGASGQLETVAFGAVLVLVLQVAPRGVWPLLVRGRRVSRPVIAASGLAVRAVPPAGAVLLEVDGLRRRFGGLAAVDGVGFSLRAGTITGLIGPNGAGKSTIFNLLSGALRPDDGRILLRGAPIARLRARRIAARGVARTFQHVKLVAGMSVLENVALGAHLRGRAGVLRALLRLDRAEEVLLFAEARRQLVRVGLAEVADRDATQLALGQQRVVEIARALCADPLLLLLDEPAAGLRHAEKQALAALLRQLRDAGVTVLLVEHDMGFVMGLADRLVVVNFGTPLAEGSPAEIRRDPRVLDAYLGADAA